MKMRIFQICYLFTGNAEKVQEGFLQRSRASSKTNIIISLFSSSTSIVCLEQILHNDPVVLQFFNKQSCYSEITKNQNI